MPPPGDPKIQSDPGWVGIQPMETITLRRHPSRQPLTRSRASLLTDVDLSRLLQSDWDHVTSSSRSYHSPRSLQTIRPCLGRRQAEYF